MNQRNAFHCFLPFSSMCVIHLFSASDSPSVNPVRDGPQMPDGARCRLLHGRNLEDFGTEIAVISAFFKGGENLLKVQTAVARIPSVVICQVYVDIVGAVPADGS